jgi:hypothetical protein
MAASTWILTARKVWNAALKRNQDHVDTKLGSATLQTTAVVNGAAVPVGLGSNMVLELVSTVLVGTLDVDVQTSKLAAGPWRSMGAFTQQTTPTTQRKSFACSDNFVRVVGTPGSGGSQSATWVVAGVSVCPA